MRLVSTKGRRYRLRRDHPEPHDVIVGPVPVEVSEEDGRAIRLTFPDIQVLDSPPTVEEPAKVETPPAANTESKTAVDFKPTVDEPPPEEPPREPDLAALASKLSEGMYMCGQCRKPHVETSGIGIKHIKLKVQPLV